uniref:Uncharacterized protein n=1 Tax=Glossina pallidipes TaxID=7398 RepID=A0A1A9Z9K3_GLOPL
MGQMWFKLNNLENKKLGGNDLFCVADSDMEKQENIVYILDNRAWLLPTNISEYTKTEKKLTQAGVKPLPINLATYLSLTTFLALLHRITVELFEETVSFILSLPLLFCWLLLPLALFSVILLSRGLPHMEHLRLFGKFSATWLYSYVAVRLRERRERSEAAEIANYWRDY